MKGAKMNKNHHSTIILLRTGRGGTLPFWEFGGSAIVSEDRIRLTPALQSRVGWVWNSVVRFLCFLH